MKNTGDWVLDCIELLMGG